MKTRDKRKSGTHSRIWGCVVPLAIMALSSPLHGQRTFTEAVKVAEFPEAGNCRGMAISSDDSTVWLTDDRNRAFAIDVAGLNISKPYKIPTEGALRIALTPDDALLCVPGFSDRNISLLDTVTGKVTASVRVKFGYPQSVVIDHAGTFAYVAAVGSTKGGSGAVDVVDLGILKFVATIRVRQNPDAMAITDDDRYVFVANVSEKLASTGLVSVIDTATRKVVATIPVGGEPTGMTIEGDRVYVNVRGDAKVVMIDIPSLTVAGSFTVKQTPYAGICITRDHYAFITDQKGRRVNVVDLLAVKYPTVGTIPLDLVKSYPFDVLVTSDGNRLVVDRIDGPACVFDLYYSIPATLEFRPSALNLKRDSGIVTAWVELPAGYEVADIDPETVHLTEVDGRPLKPPIGAVGVGDIGDEDGDGIPDLPFKFAAVDLTPWLDSGVHDVTLEGTMLDGTTIVGVFPVQAFIPGKGMNR